MKRRISAVVAAAILVLSITGCNGSKEKEEAITSAADGENATADAGAGNYAEWDAIDRNAVVAYVEGKDPVKFDVTFGEFYSEYLYYLLSYSINDDMSAKFKEACEEYRENIITYITFEHVFLEVAEEMGCGKSSLTEEDLATINANVETTRNSFISNYRTIAEEELGEGATEDEILNLCTEKLVADLAKAEFTMDIFDKWETNSYIQEKLVSHITKDVNITEEQIDDMFAEYVDGAKKAYESSKLSYETNDTYKWIYKPEGTRLADQILIAFDDETKEKIELARQSGEPEEAERIKKEAYDAEMQERVNNIIALIESGSDFNELQETYNEDTSNDAYDVIEGSEIYVKEFTDAVFSIDEIGGLAEPALSDYGVHIIMYAGDAKVTDEDMKEIRESMKSYLQYQEETKIQQEAYEEWTERYPYVIDYDLLKITPNVTSEDITAVE